MHYPLDELVDRTRERAPAGQTLAVKRASWFHPKDGSEGLLMRLRLINGTPEDYTGTGSSNLQSGLSARTVDMAVDGEEEVAVTRLTPKGFIIRQREVTAVQFEGRLQIPRLAEIAVIGATVPFEIGTGFVHVLDPSQIEQIFLPPTK